MGSCHAPARMAALDHACSRFPSPFRGTTTIRSTLRLTCPRYSQRVSGARVLLVVPTLGTRPELLRENLASIRAQSVNADVVLVAPSDSSVARQTADDFSIGLIPDPGSLPGAINAGVARASVGHEYVNWLGDDDLLEPGSLKATVHALDSHPEAVVAYGSCRYINDAGCELWVSSAGKWAPRILTWGPDLIPQPGMLVRASAWRDVGGLDESYRFAFDLDLLLRLQRVGDLLAVPQVVSAFRWHGDSLTVGDRTTNLDESDRARLAALSPGVRRWSWIWRRPVRGATRLAAWEVSRRTQKAQSCR